MAIRLPVLSTDALNKVAIIRSQAVPNRKIILLLVAADPADTAIDVLGRQPLFVCMVIECLG